MRGPQRTISFERAWTGARPGRRWGWPGLPGLVCALFLLGLAACGGGTPTPTTAQVAPPTPLATAAPTFTSPAVATVSRATATSTRSASPVASATRGIVNYPAVVRLAIEALAREVGVPQDQIIVAQVEPQDWPNSALGCPEPGRAYLQVITPGYRVILSAQGKDYEYHTNQTTMVVRCPSS